MKKDKIVNRAREHGAHVVVKSSNKLEVIYVFVGLIDIVEDEWKHSIKIMEVNSFWVIEFFQNTKTRLLMDAEIIELLDKWCVNPSDDLLMEYIDQ